MLDVVPNNNWQQANGNNVHLVITGGEPLLGWQRAFPKLLAHDDMFNLLNLTFETNGTQELHDDFAAYLKLWKRQAREITFSVSPKLSASGETWEDAIKPEIVASYEKVGTTYLKFVIETPNDFDEVDRAVTAYRTAGFTGMVELLVCMTETSSILQTKQ
jgi:organic radical activating enzyme